MWSKSVEMFDPCEALQQKNESKPMTNADRIRAMSDEELADAIYGLCEKLSDGTLHDISNLYCDGKADCITNAGDVRCNERKERGCVLRWLRQPVKEETT